MYNNYRKDIQVKTMSSITELILKKDLQYKLNNEEKQILNGKTVQELKSIRENILRNIHDGMLPIDFLEDVLTELKETEYKNYLNNEGLGKNIEEQALYLEEIEGNCSRMIINIAKGNSTSDDLLGPNIHETYGQK